jgi:predicted nuclease of predicted toxin-antitoxin system
MIRVLLDQGLAPGSASILRSHGWDAVHVYEIDFHTASDADVLEHARVTDRICVTLDHDFHAHLAHQHAGSPSVVFLRVQGLDAKAQTALIQLVLNRCAEALSGGAVVSTDGQSIRIRRLPLK